MADFLPTPPIRRVTAIVQKPSVVRCVQCGKCWESTMPMRIFKAHMMIEHPRIWQEYKDRERDIRELENIWALVSD